MTLNWNCMRKDYSYSIIYQSIHLHEYIKSQFKRHILISDMLGLYRYIYRLYNLRVTKKCLSAGLLYFGMLFLVFLNK